MGRGLNFLQRAVVTAGNIIPAPVVRLKRRVNVKCEEGLIQPLQCCVQAGYKVKWFQGTNVIPSGEYELMLKTLQSSHAEKLEEAFNSLYY